MIPQDFIGSNPPGFVDVGEAAVVTSPRLRSLLWSLALAGTSLLLAVILLLTDGNIFAGLAFLGIVLVVTITWYRLEWGFYLFIFFVFFFDQFDVPGIPSFTSSIGYFLNISTIPYLPRIPQGAVTPMEIHLLFLFFIWVLRVTLRKGTTLVPVPIKFALILFLIAVAFWFTFGQIHGGDIIISLWEIRALFYLITMFLMVPQIIRTKGQLEALFWICIAGISFKALQGAGRYAALGFSFGYWPNIFETLTNHEDPVFIITLWLLLLGLLLMGGSRKQRKVLLWLSPLLLLGFVAAQRRATYASLAVSLCAFVLLMPAKQRRIIASFALVFAVLFGIYLAMFWNSYSRLGYIAQQFKATFTDEPGVRGQKDIESTVYRIQENYNLASNIQSAPLVGKGFGRPFETPVRLWNIQINKLGTYIPHNQILWVFVKMGFIGAFTFWFFFNSFIFRGAMVFSALKDPYLRAICAVSVIAIMNQLVVSYVDMQLTFYRNMIYLGTLMGLLPVLVMLDSTPGQPAGGMQAPTPDAGDIMNQGL